MPENSLSRSSATIASSAEQLFDRQLYRAPTLRRESSLRSQSSIGTEVGVDSPLTPRDEVSTALLEPDLASKKAKQLQAEEILFTYTLMVVAMTIFMLNVKWRQGQKGQLEDILRESYVTALTNIQMFCADDLQLTYLVLGIKKHNPPLTYWYRAFVMAAKSSHLFLVSPYIQEQLPKQIKNFVPVNDKGESNENYKLLMILCAYIVLVSLSQANATIINPPSYVIPREYRGIFFSRPSTKAAPEQEDLYPDQEFTLEEVEPIGLGSNKVVMPHSTPDRAGSSGDFEYGESPNEPGNLSATPRRFINSLLRNGLIPETPSNVDRADSAPTRRPAIAIARRLFADG
jgi:hypothetical protein